MKKEQIKPLFKYIGGKSWLREELRKQIKNVISPSSTSYVEPFAGGLGSFLSVYDLLLEHNIKDVTLCDINANLIFTYQSIQNTPDLLIKNFLLLETEFASLAGNEWKLTKDKEKSKTLLEPAHKYFNQIKKAFNQNKSQINIEQSARLVFLQKHSFNGIYRENSKGEYNTPFNWSGNHMLDTIEDKVLELHTIFKSFNLTFKNQSFEKNNFNSSTVYYLDPPYLNEELGENKYNQDFFTLDKQLQLIDCIKNTSFVYSNHSSPILLDKFEKMQGITILHIARKNIMSANASTRQKDKIEILVTRVQR